MFSYKLEKSDWWKAAGVGMISFLVQTLYSGITWASGFQYYDSFIWAYSFVWYFLEGFVALLIFAIIFKHSSAYLKEGLIYGLFLWVAQTVPPFSTNILGRIFIFDTSIPTDLSTIRESIFSLVFSILLGLLCSFFYKTKKTSGS